jgi:hypothetical protein
VVTTSSNRGLQVPTVAGDAGIWGGELNTTIAGLDTILGQTLSLASSTAGTNVTLSSSQTQFGRISINNTSSSPFQLNLTSSQFGQGQYVVNYNSSQTQNLTITAGSSGTGGTSVVQGPGIQRTIWNDGVNITLEDNTVSNTPVDVGLIFGGSSTPISSGLKGQIHIPFPLTITAWRIMTDQVGSITVDVIRANNAVPLSSQSIVGGGTLPFTSSSQFSQSVPLGWTATTLATDDWLDFNVTAGASRALRASMILSCIRP